MIDNQICLLSSEQTNSQTRDLSAMVLMAAHEFIDDIN